MTLNKILFLAGFIVTSAFSTSAFSQSGSGATRDALNQLKKGNRALDAGDIEEAKSRFKKAAAMDPTLGAAWEKLASLAYAEGKYSDSIKAAQSGLKYNANLPEIMLWLGLSQQITGKITEGTKTLEKTVSLRANIPFAYYEPAQKIGLAKYYQKKNLWKKALNAYTLFMKHRPSTISKEVDHIINFRIGEASLKLKLYSKALDSCNKSLKIKNRYPSAMWCKGESLRRLQRYTEALPYFRRIAKYGGKKPRIFMGLAVSLFYSGNGRSSISYAKRYLGLRPSDPQGHVLLGDLLYATGKQKDSVRSFKRSIKLNPNSKKVYLKLGITYIRLKQFHHAIDTLKKADSLWTNDPVILVPLSYAYIQDKKADLAYNLLGKVPEKFRTPKLLTIYGSAALEAGHLDKAKVILSKALSLRSTHSITKSYMVKGLLKLGHKAIVEHNLVKSETNLLEALRIKPKNTNIIRNIALVKLMRGKIDESKKFLLAGLKLQPTDFYFTRLLGRVYLDKKDSTNALKYLELAKEKATKRSSNVLAMVQLDLGVAYSMSGDMEKSVSIFTEALSNSLNMPKLAKLIEKNLVRGLISRAANRLATGKGKEALEDLNLIKEYDQALSKSEKRQMTFLKAMAYVEQGNFKASGKQMSKLGKTSELSDLFKPPYDKFGPALLKAYISYRQMNLGNARQLFRSILKKLPARLKGQVYAFLKSCDAIDGSKLLRRGKAKKALAMFKRIPKGAMSVQVQMNMALAYYKSGKTAQAIAVWKRIGSGKASCNLGSHYHNSGNSKQSFDYLKKCAAAGMGGAKVQRLIRIKSKIFGYK
jgi:tetratricopeptide (TPR) repeat protein